MTVKENLQPNLLFRAVLPTVSKTPLLVFFTGLDRSLGVDVFPFSFKQLFSTFAMRFCSFLATSMQSSDKRSRFRCALVISPFDLEEALNNTNRVESNVEC